MRTLWYVNHYAQIPGGPGGLRHFSLSRELPKFGWEAYVIAASTELATGRQREWLTMDNRCTLTEHDGVKFVWLKTHDYSGNGWRRIRNMLEFTRSLWIGDVDAVARRPSVVIGSTVHPFAALGAYHVARTYGVPFLFEVRDLWPETLIAFGRIGRHSPFAIFFRFLETFLFKRATKIITVLPRLADYVQRIGIPADRVVWIPNGVNVHRYKDALPVRGRKQSQNQQFTLMYFGAHGQANALDTLIEAMALLEEGDAGLEVRLRMIGDGPQKRRLMEKASGLGLHTVSFEPAVANEQIPAVAREADAFVLTALNVPQLYRYGVSMNKLFDYMAAARPVVVALDAPDNPVARAGAGLVVPPEKPEKLAAAIKKLASVSHSERRELGLAGRRYVEQHYDYMTLAMRLAGVLDEVAGVR